MTATADSGPCVMCTPNNLVDIPKLSQCGLILLSITIVSITQNKSSLSNQGDTVNTASVIPYFDRT